MTAKELKEKFFEFFKERGHKIIPSASLIPENDPTVLFTTAGMHPLVPYLLGEKHPQGKRLADVQKCLRTDDIDEVGDSWHLTFFEMLGNWSLGDYFKKEAIEWSFEFLTDKKWLGVAPNKLTVTVFEGDEDAPRDDQSAEIWRKLGIPEERIYFLPKKDNWWGPAGQTGPCGPCTEMFYDSGKEKCGPDCKPGCACGKFAEIWNDVFMEYNKTADGTYEPLKQKNVDTGMGVERTIAALNGYDNVYETELFKPLLEKIAEISGAEYNLQNQKAFRIIADHLKAACFILGEGLEPSNVERGYVLRRLIRRAVRYGKQLGMKDIFTFKAAKTVIDLYQETYPELRQNNAFIEEQLVREEEKFNEILKSIPNTKKGQKISGKEAFDLYQTYGYPPEILKDLGYEFKQKEFEGAFEKHQEISRAGAEQKFKGGLADHSEIATKYHTATHLLLAALRQTLGERVIQRGSNITAQRLRLDFSHNQKMTAEEIKKVQDLVNQKIKENLEVKIEEMSLEEAKKQGALGVFESKYGQRVKVYSMGEPSLQQVQGKLSSGQVFSREICGGPHIKNTGVLGNFKIIKEEAVSAGVRRIKAILE